SAAVRARLAGATRPPSEGSPRTAPVVAPVTTRPAAPLAAPLEAPSADEGREPATVVFEQQPQTDARSAVTTEQPGVAERTPLEGMAQPAQPTRAPVHGQVDAREVGAGKIAVPTADGAHSIPGEPSAARAASTSAPMPKAIATRPVVTPEDV